MKINLCETCRKELECFMKGIFEREACDDYEPLPEEEQLEREEFIDAIMIGPCPKCGSENTTNCENEPSIDDVTVGACLDCGTHWCSECGYVFKEGEKVCPHWKFCDNCSKEKGFLDLDEFMKKICLTCEHFKEGCCQLEDLSECEKEAYFLCPYKEDVSSCPELRKYLRNLGDHYA